MPTLFVQTPDGFVALPLAGDGDKGSSIPEAPANAVLRGLRILPYGMGPKVRFALIASPEAEVRVNGSMLVGGIHVLEHKDELKVAAGRVFFSAESTPVVETYQHQGPSRRPRCPICRMEIQCQAAVRCPSCLRLYHDLAATSDTPEKHCWTFSAQCVCGHPTSMSGEPMWRPDDDQE